MLGGAEYVTDVRPARMAPPAHQVAPATATVPSVPAASASLAEGAVAPQTYGAPDAVAAAQGAPVPAKSEDGVVKLSRTYMAHGEPVARIRLRKPLALDIAKSGGLPVRPLFNENGQAAGADVKWDAIIKYVAALSEPPLPPSTVNTFVFADIEACADVLLGFFMQRD